ncbi:helix-turn-helix domain-containing protein [Microbacterium panaciterrae]|uniref:HTH cro/C1-type domain-containing protein n=1 Tax=Microbacterium panaciterrae TaxID=985759 RepID=A0ABP8PJ82_9MICO
MQAVIASPADLGRLVRYTRDSHGITQRELAARLDVSQRWLSELESGKGKQINDRYFAVLAALGIRLTATVTDD